MVNSYFSTAEAMMTSIWEQETGCGKNNKTSSAGARGHCQLMPGTREYIKNKYRVDGWSDNAEEGIKAGAYYLSEMLQIFHGDKTRAVAAYNAGPGRVKQAIEQGGDNWLGWLKADQERRHGSSQTFKYVNETLGRLNEPVNWNATSRRKTPQEEAEEARINAGILTNEYGYSKEDISKLDPKNLIGNGFLILVLGILGKLIKESEQSRVVAAPVVAPTAAITAPETTRFPTAPATAEFKAAPPPPERVTTSSKVAAIGDALAVPPTTRSAAR